MRDFVVIMLVFMCIVKVRSVGPWNKDFEYNWGLNHMSVLNQGMGVQLLINPYSGAGFRSRSKYCSGVFRMNIKLPVQKTDGIITAFYLISDEDAFGNHDEIDFEFLGTKGILQTNIFANDRGHREEAIKLWFDPSRFFHSYEINWGPKQILFKVDNRVIRVFNNTRFSHISKPMRVEASLWNGSWAGNVDWYKSPFKAYYTGFYIRATPCH